MLDEDGERRQSLQVHRGVALDSSHLCLAGTHVTCFLASFIYSQKMFYR